MKYNFLEPIKIGPITLKNRVIRPAVAEFIADPDGTVNEQYIEYYRNIARGGVSLITPGIAVVDEAAPFVGLRQPFLTDQKYVPGLKRVVTAVHAEGAKITFQLWHAGHYMIDGRPVAMVNDFTKADIERLKRKYYAAAENCKKAGADGVEYHIAHTYLPCQFMSPYFNKRTDEYGSDTIENAMRFSIECIDMIREGLCDEHFVVTAKINGDDFVEGGTTPEWAAQGARLLENAGVVMITVNGGGAITGREFMSDNGKQPEGWKVHLAETVKKQVKIPVAASGSIRHPQFVQEIIAEGRCDLVALGRGTIAEPEWVKKVEENREDEMRYCISCLHCFIPIALDGSESSCSVNPYAKCEFVKPELIRNGGGRKVAIAGAGPAGLEAAVILAERGFVPIIFERKPYIGGLVELAKVPPHKSKFTWMIEYYEKQIKRLGIEVRLSTPATAEAIAELAPHAVIVAAGSKEMIPLIPGIDSKHVIGVRELFEKQLQETEKNIVVIGAGMTGIEAAYYMANKGNNVNVIELLPPPSGLSLADSLTLRDTKKAGANFYFEHCLEKIVDGSVMAKNMTNNEQVIMPADMVILSLGIRPDKDMYDEIKDKFAKVYKVGDCSDLGKIAQAVRSGSNIGYSLE